MYQKTQSRSSRKTALWLLISTNQLFAVGVKRTNPNSCPVECRYELLRLESGVEELVASIVPSGASEHILERLNLSTRFGELSFCCCSLVLSWLELSSGYSYKCG